MYYSTNKKGKRVRKKVWGTGDKEFGNLLDKERKQGSKHIVSRFYSIMRYPQSYTKDTSVLYRDSLSPIPRCLTSISYQD